MRFVKKKNRKTNYLANFFLFGPAFLDQTQYHVAKNRFTTTWMGLLDWRLMIDD